MDGSFLSGADVVAASRDFVCVRLSTYEDATEAEFLESVFRGRSGQLENTVFTILAPDGATRLTRSGRSPDMVFGRGGDARSAMVAKMKEIAAKYPAKKTAGARTPLYVKSVRLALNVAACDNLPLVVAVGDDGEKSLADLPWKDDFVGRFVYARAESAKELEPLKGVEPQAGLVVVQPDAYGQSGEVLAQSARTADAEKTLATALSEHSPAEKRYRDHVREGRRRGIDWETEVPVTDAHANDRRR